MDQLEIRWRRPRRAQLVPELNQYPESPEVNPYPGWVSHFEPTKNGTNRKLRKSLELNEHPETPAGYYSGYYPGSELAKGIRASFRINRQDIPELNTYPATPEAAILPSFETHFEATRNRTNRRLKRLELNTYPETPAGYYSGYYPGSKRAEGFKTSFRINLQNIPQLDRYPQTVAIADIPSWETHFEPVKNNTNRRLKGVELNTYPQTPADYYTGYYPASGRVDANRFNFKIQTQVVELNTYPASAVSLVDATFGVTGLIATTFGIDGKIVATFGVKSDIDEKGQGVVSDIDETGQGVKGFI